MSQLSRRQSVALLIVSGAMIGGCALNVPEPVSDRRVTIELTANTWLPSKQGEPTIAADQNGNMLVVWASRRQEDGAFGIFAQLIDPLGRPLGTEIHVNEQILGAQTCPSVAFDPGPGRAMIVWQSTLQDGDGAGLVGRWFETSSLGARALTNEFPINANRAGDQTKPSVAINNTGRAMVAWTTETSVQTAASARLFDHDGHALSDEMTVGEIAAHSPIVAPTSDGFVIVGSSRDSAGRPDSLWMQHIDDESTLGDPIVVAETPGEQDIEPSIGIDAHGNAVVAWMRRGENRYAPMRRGFDAHGNPSTPEIIIEPASDRWLSGIAVAVAPDGRSIVSWNEESTTTPNPIDGHRMVRDSNIVAQRFDSRGALEGEPERIHLQTEGRQCLPIGAVATRSVWTSDDQIAHVWNGRTAQDSNGVGVSLSHPVQLTASAPAVFDPHPAITPERARLVTNSDAAPVFDPNFVMDPPEVNVRGAGPDFGFFGDQERVARPPDPEIAVGANHVVIVVNARLTIRRKSDGVQTFGQDFFGASGFWSELGSVSTFDPIAQYDIHTDRFIVAAAEHDNGEMFLLIAISDDSDPNGAWIKHRVNMTAFGTGMDYPILGIDDESISITANFFGDPLAAWIFIFDKAALMAGTVSFNAVQASSTHNPPTGAVMNYDINPSAQYYTSTWSSGADRLRLMAITDPNGSPTLIEHQLLVPGFANPVDADQLGTTNLADTVDWRIKHGVVRNGSMWVAHNTKVLDPGPTGPFSSRDITKVRWHEIALNGWPTSGQTPTLAQTGLIDGGFGIHSWHGDISVDDSGNAAIVFNRSSKDEYISSARAVRRATDPPGVFRQAVVMQYSTTPELLDRWGDYSGIQEDPFASGVFWSHSEYRTASWRTWVGRFSPLTPNPIDFALLTPSDLATDVHVTAMLDWEDAEDADSYDVAIATDPDLINTVAMTNVIGSSWTIPDKTLVCGAQYYWGVIANGIGGSSVSTPGVFTFTTGLLADLNGDNIIDTADLGILIAEFGSAGNAADLNNDGVVDTADLGQLIAGFGSVCN